MTNVVVIDSDAIFAIYNPNDPLNIQATQTFQKLIASNSQIVYPTPVIFEVISLFQRVLPTPSVNAKLIELVKKDVISVAVIDPEILREAVTLFDPAGSKKNTLVDCSVAIIARKMNASGVFSYDEFYVKLGLKLARDLFD